MTPQEIQQLKETLLQANNSILNTIKASLMSSYSADHDLLVEMKTQVANIRQDIKELKDGTTKRIDNLEKEKADRHELDALQKIVNDDHETRIRKIETFRSEMDGKASQNSVVIAWVIGGVGVLIGIIQLFIK